MFREFIENKAIGMLPYGDTKYGKKSYLFVADAISGESAGQKFLKEQDKREKEKKRRKRKKHKGNGLSARPIQARPKGIKIKKPNSSSTLMITKTGRFSNKTFKGKGSNKRIVRQGTFGTVYSEFGKTKF